MTHTSSDVQAGLIVRLDSDALRTLGGCQTNAVQNAHGDRAVRGIHDFLVVYVDVARGIATAVPLFNKSAVGNQPLVESLQSGAADGWIGHEWYFSRWQHWRIPTQYVADAWNALPDEDAAARRYAAGDASALDDIRIWESQNRAPYRDA